MKSEKTKKICLVLGMAAAVMWAVSGSSLAAQPDGEVKIVGVLSQATPDPSGALAPFVFTSSDKTYKVTNNKIALKMAKHIGKNLEITGKIDQDVLTPWIFVPAGSKPKAQPTG